MKNLISKILLTILALLELSSIVLMFLSKNIWGSIIHGIILIAFLVIGILALRNLNSISLHNKQHAIASINAYHLLNTDLILLIMITIHDFDHMRQAMNWGYTFTLSVLLVNLIVYLPGLISIYLISERRFSGIITTIISGPLIAISFLKIHLFGAWIPVWGPWNKSFFALRVDSLSWGILILTAVVGVIVAMIGTYFLGKENERIKF